MSRDGIRGASIVVESIAVGNTAVANTGETEGGASMDEEKARAGVITGRVSARLGLLMRPSGLPHE